MFYIKVFLRGDYDYTYTETYYFAEENEALRFGAKVRPYAERVDCVPLNIHTAYSAWECVKGNFV